MAKKWDDKPPSQIRLIWAGKELTDDRVTLRGYGASVDDRVSATRQRDNALRSLKISASSITIHITKRQPVSVRAASAACACSARAAVSCASVVSQVDTAAVHLTRADALVGSRRECQPSYIIAQVIGAVCVGVCVCV